MWWWFGGIMAVFWITCLLVAGLATYANGHKALFWIGIIFPVLWFFGAFMTPKDESFS